MTTGTRSSGSLVFAPEGETRSWVGDDGQYTIIDGFKVLKYNNYTLDYSYQKSVQGSGGIWIYSGITPNSWPFSNNDQLELLGRLRDKISSTNFNLAVDLAEGHQVVDMAVGTILSLSRSIRSLRHGDFAGAARALGIQHHKPTSRLKVSDVSGRWLELQYGWLPLVSDVYQAALAWSKRNDPPRLIRVSSSLKRQVFQDASQSPTFWSSIGPVSVRSRIIAELREGLSVPRQLGLTNPLDIIWELIPYSFVIDWFLPIGSYLELLNQIPSLKGRFLTSTVSKAEFISLPYPQFLPFGYDGAWQYSKHVVFQRTASTSLSVPFPSFRAIPAAMSAHHIYNAVALAHQRILS